jgi:Smg protein
MKETDSVLEVLVYLFEHYFYDESEAAETHDRDSLQASLVQAGFSPTEIAKAFDWLEELEQRRPEGVAADASAGGPFRVFGTDEMDRLDTECRGFLMFLEQSGVLSPEQRELVLDRVVALGESDIDLIDVKWVVLMVMFNQPGQEAAFAWLESDLLEGDRERIH